MPSHDALGEGPFWCTRCETWHSWRHQEGDFRVFSKDIKECCKNAMGSHYHCGRCDRVSSMMGCYTQMCRAKGRMTEGHMCCPNDCELDNE